MGSLFRKLHDPLGIDPLGKMIGETIAPKKEKDEKTSSSKTTKTTKTTADKARNTARAVIAQGPTIGVLGQDNFTGKSLLGV